MPVVGGLGVVLSIQITTPGRIDKIEIFTGHVLGALHVHLRKPTFQKDPIFPFVIPIFDAEAVPVVRVACRIN